MDTQTIINGLFGLLSMVFGWFARELWSATKELQSDLAKLRADMPTLYVTKDDFKDDIHEIKNMIQKIFDKLDSKQDRDYR